MATGAPAPNADNLSEEELERLTAPATTAAAPETVNAAAPPSNEVEKQEVTQPTPSAADLDANAAEQSIALATGGIEAKSTPETVNPTQPVHPVVPAVPEPAAVAQPDGDAGDESAPAPAVDTTIEPGHQFTGKIVKVHVAIKDMTLFDHVFNVSTEPLVEIINRAAKAKFGIDLTLLPGLKLTCHGEEVADNAQAHLLGLEDEAEITVTYD